MIELNYQASVSIGALRSVPQTVSTVAPVELTLEQELLVAKHLADVALVEEVKAEAFQKVLRIMQKMVRGNTANSMPTASKLKAWEVPMLQYALEFASRSAENRWIVTRLLVENLDIGSGFFSINRAKQGLKVVAKNAGFESLTGELESEHLDGRRTAAHLLGWMKREKALLPLVRAYCVGARSDRRMIARIIRTHYGHILPQYKQRCEAEFGASFESLLTEPR
jgi:hypothetical protein